MRLLSRASLFGQFRPEPQPWSRPPSGAPFRDSYDVIVVGGGVRACAIARACAVDGASVALLAPDEISGAAAERAFPVVRAVHADPLRTAIQADAVKLLARQGARLDPAPNPDPTGLVTVAAFEDDVAGLAAIAEDAKAEGAAAWMIPAREVAALSVALAGGGGLAPALFEPGAVTLDADILAFGLANAAATARAELCHAVPVLALRRDAGAVVGVEIAGRSLLAGAVVLADDQSAIRLVREGKGRLSLRREERMIMQSETRAPSVGPAIEIDDLTISRDQTGAVTLSGPFGSDQLAARMVALAPALAALRITAEEPVTLWTGVDGRAQIGAADIAGLWLSLGFGRDALSLALAAGQNIADQIGDRRADPAFAPFAPTRRPVVRASARASR
jgi:glycine/D-amino acid oxidase-like deaminating enzyme